MSGEGRHTPFLLELYEQYLESRDAVGFVLEVSKRYSSGTLQRLVSHPQCEIRRAAVLSLGFIGDYAVNHSVGRAIQDDDRTVRLLADKASRSVWNRAGSDLERQQLIDIIRLNAAERYHDAIQKASELLDDAPGFAEAWYQRGAAFFQLNRFGQAIHNCSQALEFNPYHFVAATVLGEAFLRLDSPVSALEAFRRAVRLNPDLDEARARVVQLTSQVEDE